MSMPEVYEDTLPSVIPMNRDYDCGYVDENQEPLRDNTFLIPDGALPPPAYSEEDDLVPAIIILPANFHGTWTLTIPTVNLRVWRYAGVLVQRVLTTEMTEKQTPQNSGKMVPK